MLAVLAGSAKGLLILRWLLGLLTLVVALLALAAALMLVRLTILALLFGLATTLRRVRGLTLLWLAPATLSVGILVCGGGIGASKLLQRELLLRLLNVFVIYAAKNVLLE